MSSNSQQLTRPLHDWSGGTKEALDELMPKIYDELRRLAARCLYSERPDHTLRATALVNEAYLRLAHSRVNYQDRIHFFAVAAGTLRHILVDYAKTRNREKRGGGGQRVTLDEAVVVGPETPRDLLDLDDALNALAVHDPRKAKVVELLFFGGLTYDEAAVALKVSVATIHRELKMAKAWLFRELAKNACLAG